MSTVLRPYQAGAIQALRNLLKSGNKRIMTYSATGSGKTEIAMDMIQRALEKEKKVAFVVNRKQLLSQTSKRFSAAGIRHGIIQAKNTRNIDAKCLVCSIDTIHTRGLPFDIDLMIIDEAHEVPGSVKYLQMIFKRNNVPVIGLSASPFSLGLGKIHPELGGEALFQDMVVAATLPELIEDGYLCDVVVYGPPKNPDLSQVKVIRDKFGLPDYNEQQLGAAMDRPDLIGDIVLNWKLHGQDAQTVCFASSIAHSNHIVEQFNANGIPAVHIDCYMTDDERNDILERYAAGEWKVISCYSLLAKGWDCPAAKCMILARPTKSLILWIQMTGRIIRKYGDWTEAILLDHSGTCEELGYPTAELPLELNDGIKKPAAAPPNIQEEKPTRCMNCWYMKPPKTHVCPKCGYAHKKEANVTVMDAVLEKVKKQPPSHEQKQAFFSELIHIQQEKGYQLGWVMNNFAKKFKEPPRGYSHVPQEPSPSTRSWVTSRNIAYAKGKAKGGNHATA